MGPKSIEVEVEEERGKAIPTGPLARRRMFRLHRDGRNTKINQHLGGIAEGNEEMEGPSKHQLKIAN